MSNSIPGIPRSEAVPALSARQSPGVKGADFTATLREAIQQVEGLQGDAQQKVAELLQGNGEDIHSAMIAVEKADLSFQLMMQVRNKIVQAYQEISRMPF